MEKRLEQLEALLNKMENNAREELARAAAAAAARILREELATLFAAGAE
jgi:flagellar biosynthesis/type III secretory pathway protein FliH